MSRLQQARMVCVCRVSVSLQTMAMRTTAANRISTTPSCDNMALTVLGSDRRFTKEENDSIRFSQSPQIFVN